MPMKFPQRSIRGPPIPAIKKEIHTREDVIFSATKI